MLVRRTTRAPLADGAPLPGALRRGLLALGVVVPVAALAVGCTSNPEPPPLADPPASSPVSVESPSPSSTAPTVPVMPDAARGTGPKAAKAFVRYFVAVLNYSTATGDTKALTEVSGKQCKACQAVVDAIEHVDSNGGYYKGDGWSVRSIKYEPLQPRLRPVVLAGVSIAPQEYLDHTGAEPRHFKGGKRSMTFRLGRLHGLWIVRALEQADD